MFSDVHYCFKTECDKHSRVFSSAILWLLDIFTTKKDNQQSLDLFIYLLSFPKHILQFQPLRDLIERKSPAVIGTELSTTFPRT